jgi:hypothetical protein
MSTTRTVLISEIAGQDGSHLAECVLGKGYEVHGIVRRVILKRKVPPAIQKSQQNDRGCPASGGLQYRPGSTLRGRVGYAKE